MDIIVSALQSLSPSTADSPRSCDLDLRFAVFRTSLGVLLSLTVVPDPRRTCTSPTRHFCLSLTHFCEVHGPTSILCSQILPFSCPQCYPDPSEFSPKSSLSASHDTSSSHGTSFERGRDTKPVDRSRTSAAHQQTSATSSPLRDPNTDEAIDSTAATDQKIEESPLFLRDRSGHSDTEKLNRFGGAEGDTCASCSLTLPDDVSKQLPVGAPGTPKEDGKGRNGSPVLRSREVVYSCGSKHDEQEDDYYETHPHHSSPDSLRTSAVSSDSACHTHLITYLSLRGPPNLEDYALLRRSSIRTLSCELLPRGLSSGPLCFGDSEAGYTIAYIFRLPDPKARGKRRSYALVALAGKDSRRAFRATPIIWRAFERIASSILNAAERYQEEERRREDGDSSANSSEPSSHFTPVSSFLTGRTVDPDGHSRRAGQIRARNLAEIVGNEYIFAELHAQFVVLLQQLGQLFGGLPISEERFICSTIGGGREAGSPASIPRSSPAEMSKDSTRRKPRHTHEASDIGAPAKPIPIGQRRSVVA
ncbi:hypothetical protein FQN54_009345 [Arachnomyces sp. PD_36]|nr:hypothetical protein FQN54_009345 [Arachnomyces sp. PD_36]